jgi:hypothetical protein
MRGPSLGQDHLRVVKMLSNVLHMRLVWNGFYGFSVVWPKVRQVQLQPKSAFDLWGVAVRASAVVFGGVRET